MRQLSRKLLGYVLLLIILLVSSCTAPLKPAILRDSAFQESPPSAITLLPAIDVRFDKEIEVNLQKQIRDAAKGLLEKKGYLVRTTSDLTATAGITEDDIKLGLADWIKQLPSDDRWVMILVLVDVKTQLTFGSTGNAEVAGALFDKVNATTIWRDKGIGKSGQGGLLGMAMKGMMDEQAIAMAVGNLMASIPKRPK
jgi:hypothetical protein